MRTSRFWLCAGALALALVSGAAAQESGAEEPSCGAQCAGLEDEALTQCLIDCLSGADLNRGRRCRAAVKWLQSSCTNFDYSGQQENCETDCGNCVDADGEKLDAREVAFCEDECGEIRKPRCARWRPKEE